MRFSPVRSFWIAGLVVLTALFGYIFRSGSGPNEKGLPDYGEVASFNLVSSAGNAVTRADFRGSVWLADVIFTRCGGQCPIMTGRMKALDAELPASVKLVSFTTDPDYDSPGVLGEYAKNQGVSERRWMFLTGSAEDLSRVTASFHMNTVDEPLLHSTRFILVDARFRIRGIYDPADPDALHRVKRDAKLLLTRNNRENIPV